MDDAPHIAAVAALIGDPARANILVALMDGRALTATELSHCAGVSAQTTSAHLAKLADANLLTLERQGRHRYFRLSGPAVGQAVEALMVLAANGPSRHRPPSQQAGALRQARTCYDHLAGTLGVALTQAMVADGRLAPAERDFRLTDDGEAFLRQIGVDVALARRQRRAFARQCIDWSERRPHLGGALGAALANRCFELDWLRRAPEGRNVVITEAGGTAFDDLFGMRF